MMVISSSDLLNEFTLYANKVVDEKETIIVQRSNSKNIVLLSIEQYNEMQKQIFLAKKCNKKNREAFSRWI